VLANTNTKTNTGYSALTVSCLLQFLASEELAVNECRCNKILFFFTNKFNNSVIPPWSRDPRII